MNNPPSGKTNDGGAPKPSPKKQVKALPEQPTVIDKVKKYFMELGFEWQKLTFPTRKELIQSTIVVFLFTMLLMAVISLYDVALTAIFSVLLPIAAPGQPV